MSIASKCIIKTDPGEFAFGIEPIYNSMDSNSMFRVHCVEQASDCPDNYFKCFSDDNGETWSEPEILYEAATTEEGIWRYAEVAMFFDDVKNALIMFYDYSLYRHNDHSDRNAWTRLMYRVSYDGGHSFSDPIQLICKGCDKLKWAPGIEYGRNAALVSFAHPKMIEGGIVLPVQVITDNLGFYSAACLLGSWNDNGQLEWEMSNLISCDSTKSVRGMIEPTIERLSDGRLLAVMRASNDGFPGQRESTFSSCKYRAISNDGGLSWSEPEPWLYDDQAAFFSPSSGSAFMRHSKSGELFWFGNICERNPQGNFPRYPLVMGKVDDATGFLIRSSVISILKREETDSEWIQFSNFKVSEDRMTGDFIVSLPHFGEFTKKITEWNYTAYAYEHKIYIDNNY